METAERMECMCTECGISHYLEKSELVMDAMAGYAYPVVTNQSCSRCGGLMIVIGKEGDQPYYRVD